MIKIELTEGDVTVLSKIVSEHATRLGKRKSVPVGRSIFDVSQEISLCEKLAGHLSERKGEGVEIGKRTPASSGPK